MSKIEDLVIFKNEKDLSETKKSMEEIFGISFQSYVRRLEIGLDAEGLSHDDDSAVAHILADMGKKDSILWIFSLCCEDSREAAKILYEKQKRAIEATNTTQIKKLYTIKQKLENAKTHAEFDKLLQEISAVDAEIDHDNLTSEQKTHYDQLNKSCTDTISAKMRQLEYKDNIDYNKKAVNAYNSAFTSFKNNESRYKDKSQLFGLVSTTLFAYDAGRLFNETLIFYNHVYSYIFSKLDDNGKLELTRYSIECERKLR